PGAGGSTTWWRRSSAARNWTRCATRRSITRCACSTPVSPPNCTCSRAPATDSTRWCPTRSAPNSCSRCRVLRCGGPSPCTDPAPRTESGKDRGAQGRFGGGLPAAQPALQGDQQTVPGFAGVDELVESELLSGVVGGLQFGLAQLGGEVLCGVG